MYFRNQSNEEILNTCRIRVDNSLSSRDIMAAVAKFNYDKEALERGKSLLEKATELHRRQIREYNEQFAATRQYNKVFERAHEQYMDYVKIARITFKNDADTYHRLGLFGERSRKFVNWLPQVRRFYREALEDAQILEALRQWNITRKDLESGLVLMEETVEAHDAQVRESGEAQQATQDRDAAIDALYEWTDDYQTIAEIALKNKPQLLEKLGIVVKSK